MKIWLSKRSEVPLTEQITIQIVLGIVSADLSPGEQLPSTTEVGRRFHVHPNSVRAAYRHLVKSGWLEWRHGSGFYVRDLQPDAELNPDVELDQLIAQFLRSARERGYSLDEIQTRVSRSLVIQPPDRIIVIEPEIELRKILVAEINNHLGLRVQGIGVEQSSDSNIFLGAFSVALYDSAKEIQPVLRKGISCMFLHSRSISKTLLANASPPENQIITIVSRWPMFLQWSRTVLVAANIDPETIRLLDARKKGWEKRIRTTDFVIADSLLASQLPKKSKASIFQIISDESIRQLQALLVPAVRQDDAHEIKVSK